MENYPRPSTIVAITYFNAHIYLENLFWILPVIKDQNKFVKRASPRARFNWIAEAGTVLAVRYKKRMRGIKKKDDNKEEQLKNNLNIDMSLSDKNVNLNIGYSKKDNRSSLHMTGITNIKMIDEIYSFISFYLKNLQNKINYLNLHPEIVENLKKEVYNRIGYPLDKNDLINEENSIFFEIFDLMDNWEEFLIYIDIISQIRYIYQGNLEKYSSNLSAIISNYNLGFPIDRKKLAKLAKDKRGFFSRYSEADGDHDVNLSLLINANELNSPFKKQKGKKPEHKFKIKKSGCVKQTTPGNMIFFQNAYLNFMELMKEIGDDVRV